MYYINNDIPSSYKYLIDYGSNYIVLTNSSFLSGSSGDPDIVNSYIVFSEPSFSYLPYLYYSYESRSLSDVSSDLTNDFYFARDFPFILSVSILVLFCLLLIFNGFTRLILRGGVLFNK